MEKQKEIINKYKNFFKNIDNDKISLMCFGFECDKGWYGVIENLFEDISKCSIPDGFEITQIKEKLGGLRVYTDNSSDEIEDLISKAEKKASKTCEICGDSEAVLCSTGYWLKTLCDKCLENNNNFHKVKKYENKSGIC